MQKFPAMGQLITRLFQDYHANHLHKKNEISHMIGIPLIILSIFGFLTFLPTSNEMLSAPTIFWGIGNFFYILLNPVLGIGMCVITAGLWYLANFCSLPVLIGIHVFGWVSQFIGHYYYEKKSPAFYKNLIHLLIGPAYILNLFLKQVKY